MTSKDDRLWYKNAIFYQVNVRAFYDSNGDGHGDLKGLEEKLDYLQELGVDCIWLMPIYPSPLCDDGYDISDYYGILEHYGTRDDFRNLVKAAHQRSIRVIADLVLNHTSDQHTWFQKARNDPESPYRNFYVWSKTDQKYAQARIIFLDTERSNWAWDEQAGLYYWHRFYASQPDLNFDNPDVQEEMLRVIKFWLDMGIDGFRADAVPYLFEREGTNCENLPETHTYLKKIRQFVDNHYPGSILLCEANQWPQDVHAYFGEGDEFQMGFHFPLMPRIFMALRKGDGTPIRWILDQTPEIPETCQWCTFLRNHDELTLEMVTAEERQWMWQEYAPVSGMRLNLGIRRRLAPLLDNDRRKIEIANSLLFSLVGTPIIYYGDEIGMGDNIELRDRNGVRTPMQWADAPNAGFSQADKNALYVPVIQREPYSPLHVNVERQKADPSSLWHTIRKMIAVRKEHPELGWGSLTWVDTHHPEVLGYWRRSEHGQLLLLNNLCGQEKSLALALPTDAIGTYRGLLSHKVYQTGTDGLLNLRLPAYGYEWLKKAD